MKRSVQRQASDDYDQLRDDRLVKAAYEFNLKFAAGFRSSTSRDHAPRSEIRSGVARQPHGARRHERLEGLLEEVVDLERVGVRREEGLPVEDGVLDHCRSVS